MSVERELEEEDDLVKEVKKRRNKKKMTNLVMTMTNTY